MRVTAGIEIDPRVGPGVDAAIGEVAVEALGLLQILETHLGLVGPKRSHAERVAWLYGRLRDVEGYWSASLQADPWGTASRLVRDRDALAMQGWRGQPVSRDWDARWAVTADMPPGPPDRWAEVERTIEQRCIAIEQLRLVDPELEWPGAIRRVFERLRRAGVAIEQEPEVLVQAHGDVAAARSSRFEPQADGSLQLVRPQAVTTAAEDVAAFLAALRDDAPESDVLIVTPDTILDAALRRAGLPTTGAPSATVGARDPALQVLPLCLELLWDPADPQAALELLCLPRTPIPRRLAGRLVQALRQWPALGSDDWNEALAEYDFTDDGKIDDATAQRRRDRVALLLDPVVPLQAGALPMGLVRARVEAVAAWARRLGESNADVAADWRRAGAQHQSLLRLLEAVGGLQIPASLLARLIDAATATASESMPYAAQAGLRAVTSAGAVIRPVDCIVWWNFTREAAPTIRDMGLSRAERAALAEAGIELPTAGDRAAAVARRWRRPLSMARQRLLLVCPRTAGSAERLHPHPLWDEIVASMPDEDRDAMSAALTVARPGLGKHPAAPRSLAQSLARPTYVDRWDVPAGALKPRDRESPSGLGALVGCSLKWALRYPLRVSDSRASYRMLVGPREHGSLAHAILAEVLADPVNLEDAARARDRAAEVFDALGPRRVAALFRPGRDGEREQIRLSIMESAVTLVQWLQTYGLRVRKVEETLEGALEGHRVGGQVDLLVGDPPVVIDFKWGGRSSRQEEIETGTAYQLATYAWAATEPGAAMPEYGYFIVRDRLMLGRAGGPFDPNNAVDGPSVSEAWDGFARAFGAAQDEVSAGRLLAPGGREDAPAKPQIVNGRLVLPTPCKYCSYDALCGSAFGEDGA